MSQVKDIIKGDTLQKVGSAGFIIGAVLLIIFNILYPRPADPSSTQSVLRTMAEHKFLTQLSQLMLAMGFLGVMIGSAGVYSSITYSSASWARLGFYGILVATPLWFITFGLGTTTANAAAEWVVAATVDKAAAYSIAAAILTASSGIYTISIVIFWLAIIFLGRAMARSKVYARWHGWTAVVLGIVMLTVVGIPRFLGGEVGTSSVYIFAGLSLLTTVWFLVVGIWVARKAW